jgi:hypothetical protein
MITLQDLQYLIEAFEAEHPDCELDDVEVRFAHQPDWPFELEIASPDTDGLAIFPSRADDGRLISREGRDVVYLAEAGQVGYLPGDVAESLGWRNR